MADLVAGHCDAMLAFYGRDLGRRVARKHLGWYMAAANTPASLHRAILTETDPARVLHMLRDAFTPETGLVA